MLSRLSHTLRRRRDERGFAMPAVVMIIMVGFMLSSVIAASTLGSVQQTTHGRSSVQAFAAAEAGRDSMVASLYAGDEASCPVSTTDVSVSDEAGASTWTTELYIKAGEGVTPSGFDASGAPVGWASTTCIDLLTMMPSGPGVTEQYVVAVAATGTAADGTQRVIDALYPWEVVGPDESYVAPVIGPITFGGESGFGNAYVGDVVVTGNEGETNFICGDVGDPITPLGTSATVIEGDVYVLKGDALFPGPGCYIKGNLYVQGNVTVKNPNTAGGVCIDESLPCNSTHLRVTGHVRVGGNVDESGGGGFRVGRSLVAKGNVKLSQQGAFGWVQIGNRLPAASTAILTGGSVSLKYDSAVLRRGEISGHVRAVGGIVSEGRGAFDLLSDGDWNIDGKVEAGGNVDLTNTSTGDISTPGTVKIANVNGGPISTGHIRAGGSVIGRGVADNARTGNVTTTRDIKARGNVVFTSDSPSGLVGDVQWRLGAITAVQTGAAAGDVSLTGYAGLSNGVSYKTGAITADGGYTLDVDAAGTGWTEAITSGNVNVQKGVSLRRAKVEGVVAAKEDVIAQSSTVTGNVTTTKSVTATGTDVGGVVFAGGNIALREEPGTFDDIAFSQPSPVAPAVWAGGTVTLGRGDDRNQLLWDDVARVKGEVWAHNSAGASTSIVVQRRWTVDRRVLRRSGNHSIEDCAGRSLGFCWEADKSSPSINGQRAKSSTSNSLSPVLNESRQDASIASPLAAGRIPEPARALPLYPNAQVPTAPSADQPSMADLTGIPNASAPLDGGSWLELGKEQMIAAAQAEGFGTQPGTLLQYSGGACASEWGTAASGVKGALATNTNPRKKYLIDATACTDPLHFTLSVTGVNSDAVILVNSFRSALSFTSWFPSNGTAADNRRVFVIQPDADPTDKKPTCAGRTRFGIASFHANANTPFMFYSPCGYEGLLGAPYLNTSRWWGQLIAGAESKMRSSQVVCKPMSLAPAAGGFSLACPLYAGPEALQTGDDVRGNVGVVRRLGSLIVQTEP